MCLSARKVAVTLVIICIVLAGCLDAIINRNSHISQVNSGVNSTLGLLFPYFPIMQNQSTSALNLTGATFVCINQINIDPTKWLSQKVAVVGRLSGPYPFPTAISYYYVLSLDETVPSSTGLDIKSIGIDFGNRGAISNGSTALVVGEVKKGAIGTNVAGAHPTPVYYIEEQAVLIF